MENEDSEPLVVLVLNALAVISVLGGMTWGTMTANGSGFFIGLTAGAFGALGWWALGTIIGQLHRIEANTRQARRADTPKPVATQSLLTKPAVKAAPETYKL